MKPSQLKEWRHRNGYSQGQLAKILGVAAQTVYRWETERREIPSFLALALECLERRGGEEKRGKGKKKGKGVKK